MKKVYLFAAFAAVLVGFATYMFASSLDKNSKIENVPTSDVVVAVVDIKENASITAEMVEIKKLTNDSIAPGAAKTLEEVVGKLSKYPITAGEQVIKDKVFTLGEDQKDSALSYQLKKGEYAYSLSVDNVQGVSGFIGKGDLVDVIYTKSEKTVVTTKFLLRKIRILKIANYAANYAADTQSTPITAYSEVVLCLNEDQVLSLTKALSDGSIKLALNSITVPEQTVK